MALIHETGVKNLATLSSCFADDVVDGFEQLDEIYKIVNRLDKFDKILFHGKDWDNAETTCGSPPDSGDDEYY